MLSVVSVEVFQFISCIAFSRHFISLIVTVGTYQIGLEDELKKNSPQRNIKKYFQN
jgi:hypothetical protein